MDETMNESLEESAGLPVMLNEDTFSLGFGDKLNKPTFRVRELYDLNMVWANPKDEENRVLYKVTSGLWLNGDEAIWKSANIMYGIVLFSSGTVGGEFIKSSGQYHPICAGNTKATPEIYTVLKGIGHFLLQKATPPYEVIEDAVLVEVHEGETFVVPPDYGHLQINPGNNILVFSYAVMDGLEGVYEPYRKKRGAIYYEIAEGPERYVFNTNYPRRIPLRFIRAGQICQLPFLDEEVTYQKIRDSLYKLRFLTDPNRFPTSAML
jgi:glucose-6-phosphate isomerase